MVKDEKSIVDKDSMSVILEAMSKMQDKLDKLESENKRLAFAADKSLLNTYDIRNQEAKGKEVKLRCMDGKIIVRWSNMTTNFCGKGANGVYIEDQKLNLTLEDGKIMENVPYLEWMQKYTHVSGKILSETKEKDGNIIFKVEMEDGRTLDINYLYVN